ncbi:chemotaxis protein CheV, partial [Vibrio parahaemolyticus]|nr:chemotaxis protein CheV [Vibrio parahaemolyticus]
DVTISEDILDQELAQAMVGRNVLIVDDSSTARNQVRDTLSQLGMNIIECRDGLEALTVLKRWCDEGKDVEKELLMMITDA